MTESPSLLRRIDNTHIPMLLARLVVGGLFVYMAIHKVDDPVKFLKDIREYNLLPESPPYFLNLAAVVLPWVEIICGVLLIIGFWLRGAGSVVLVLMVSFTGAIFLRAIGVYSEGGIAFCGIEFDCGCGSGVINICKKLLTNLSLIGLTVIALASRSRLLTIESLLARRPGRHVPAPAGVADVVQ